ncbi:hypothetical protein [Rhizohabitans arisaemae]|uniref:hypothetical protein n=1 Tax=Rhizohabitans arisaemae TaxID=2720610 RepID=UPI0024B11964|nr:hypothetical protein [Rhizohabitans arisaemae]
MHGTISRAWQWHRPLMLLTGTMAVLTVATLIGLVVDGRTIDGQSVWAKPLKFAISFGLYAFTWAWLFSMQRRARRLCWWLGTSFTVVIVLEVAIIVLQAARGLRSHFNVSTELDAQLFGIMGLAVVLLFIANIVAAVLVLLDRHADRAGAWAIRFGLILSTAGMGLGALMTSPTAEQQAGVVKGLIGAHSVGVRDGGPGIPVIGWSTTGGDLRIPHFIGMHALQLLPLAALLLLALAARFAVLRDEGTRVRLIVVAGTGYAGLVALATWQALRGQPLVHPDGTTLIAFGLLVASVATAVTVTLRRSAPAGPYLPPAKVPVAGG